MILWIAFIVLVITEILITHYMIKTIKDPTVSIEKANKAIDIWSMLSLVVLTALTAFFVYMRG